MIEVCLRIASVGADGADYGFKVGQLVNRNVFMAVRKDLMSQGKDLPSYDKSVVTEDGKISLHHVVSRHYCGHDCD